jgi:hypothetical protein
MNPDDAIVGAYTTMRKLPFEDQCESLVLVQPAYKLLGIK